MNKSKIIVAIYIRVSTAEQANEGYSIGEQKERLEKYAEAHSWIVYKVYSDPGYSGGSKNRPALTSMINDIQNGKVDKVLVYKLDRLSRSQKDTLYLIEDVFLKNNVDFVSMTENLDTSSPFGIAMIGILSVFAQLEREQIRERMQVGLDARAKEGYFHGGAYAPIGYDYIDGELVVNEYEALQLRKMYELFLSGMPVYSIFKYMATHYTTKYGPWKNSTVYGCLKNILYTGKITWKGNIYEGRHESIIDEDTYNKAQKQIAERNKEFPSHPFKRTSLLGGLIWCGNCGARYFCKHNVSRRPGITPVNKYYTCYSRGKTQKRMIKDPNCKNKSWNVKAFDQIILDEIRKLALDPNLITDLLENSDTTTAENERITLEKRIVEIDKQIGKLVDLYQLGTIDYNVIGSKIEKLNREKEILETELGSITVSEPDLSIIETREILKTLPDVIETADPEALKQIVHSLIDAIIINGEDIEIHWKFT